MKTAAPSRSENALLAGILSQVADGLIQPLLDALRRAIVEEVITDCATPEEILNGETSSPLARRSLPFEVNYAGHGDQPGWSSQVHLLATCLADASFTTNGSAEKRTESPAVAAGWAKDSKRSVLEHQFVEVVQQARSENAPLMSRILSSANRVDGLLLWLPLIHRKHVVGHVGVSLWESCWCSVPAPVPSTWSGISHVAGWEHATWVLPAQWSHPRYRRQVPAWLVRLATGRRELAALRDGFTRWNQIRRQLEHVLVPTIRTASWKKKAGRIMHELANSISTMDAPLESIAQELSRSVLDLRYRQEDADAQRGTPISETLTGAIDKMQSVITGFDFLRRNQSAAKNKILWYFFLMEGKLKAEEEEKKSLRDLLAETFQRLDAGADTYRLGAADDPMWATALAMPPQFLGHCAQALLSNSVRHRRSGSWVEFTIAMQDDGSLQLEWKNFASEEHLERLRQAFDGNAPASFGLIVAREVSQEFLGSELTITTQADRVIHSIRLQRCSATPDVFFSLSAWLQSRKSELPRRLVAQ